MSRARWPGEDPDRRPPEIPPPWRPMPDRPAPRPYPPVPTVPVDLPRSRPDLVDRLLERRIVLVSGHLDHDLATAAAAQLMLLDADDDAPVELRLSCPDGDLDAAAVVADTLDLLGVPVRAVVTGRLGGPALGPLAAAHHRVAHPHALLVLRDPSIRAEGRADDLTAAVTSQRQQVASLHERLARASGRSVAEVAADMRAGRTLRAEEAVAYGLLHELVRPA